MSIHVDGITSLPTWVHELDSLTPEARQLLVEIIHWHLLRNGAEDSSTLYRDYHAIMVGCLIAEEGPLLSSTIATFHAVDSDDVHRIIRKALREWLSHSHGLQQSFVLMRELLVEVCRFCDFSAGLKESLWG